jgi:hypothetical protein
VTFGSPETTTGGNALKFYASMRFDVRRIGQVKVGDEPVGGRTRVKIAKNKCAPPFTEAEFEIRWGMASIPRDELLDLGVARGLGRQGRQPPVIRWDAARQRTREVARDARREPRSAKHAQASHRGLRPGAAGEASRSRRVSSLDTAGGRLRTTGGCLDRSRPPTLVRVNRR